jgi:serine/threonine-protein kinase
MEKPEKIGKYEISEKIGVGGFGAVYRARDPFIKRTVAIKTCQVNDQEIKSRFFREAEMAGNLHHRHITTIYDFGVENGIPYIVQEFLTGEDLDKQIKRGDPIPVARKVEILMAIADGLEYAHNGGIIHRDIKPANVRILENGSIKIMDFGIAKSLQSESSLTQTGITLGTSAYLAPEQIRGEPVDRRTDIFSLGILAYELLTLRKPFRGEHLSTVLYKILNEEPEPVSELAPDVPPPLAAIVRRAMEKAPARRYPSMEVLRRELQAVFRELTGLSAPDFSPRPTEDAKTVRSTATDMDATLPTPTRGVAADASITPPSGALARQPAASEATPTSAPSRLAGPSLELINFRSPAEAVEATMTGASPAPRPVAAAASRRARIGIGMGIVLLAGLGAAAVYFAQNRTQAIRQPPGVSPRPAATAAPQIEFPEPHLGQEPNAAPPAAAGAQSAVPGEEPAAKTPEPAAAAPAPRPVAFQFSSIPIATLYVDGRKIGPSVPAKTLELTEGRHRVRFESPGLPPHEQEFRVGPGEANRLHYQFPIGLLVIAADASWTGASVILDGKYKGSLPDAARLRLPAGAYSITLHREGWRPVTERVDVGVGSQKVWTPPSAVPVEPEGVP